MAAVHTRLGRSTITMEAGVSGRYGTLSNYARQRGPVLKIPRAFRTRSHVKLLVMKASRLSAASSSVTPIVEDKNPLQYFNPAQKLVNRVKEDPDASLLQVLANKGVQTLIEKFVSAADLFQDLPPKPLEDTVPPESLADVDSRFLQVNPSVKLHYKLSRNSKLKAGAPAVMCIHGFQGSTFSWRMVLESLGDAVTEVAGVGAALSYDRPPYGLSNRPTTWQGGSDCNPYTVAGGARLGFQLLDKLRLGSAVLVAHSAGAGVALRAARSQPNRVKGLVLICPAVYVDSPLAGATFETYLNLLYTRTMLNIPGVNLNYIRKELNKAKSRVENDQSLGFFDESKVTGEMVYGYTRPMQTHDWDVGSVLQYQSFDIQPPELLEGLDIPILIIQGKQDKTVPASVAKKLHAALNGRSQYIELDECGHLPMDEIPARLESAMLPFIRRVLQSSEGTESSAAADVQRPVIREQTNFASSLLTS